MKVAYYRRNMRKLYQNIPVLLTALLLDGCSDHHAHACKKTGWKSSNSTAAADVSQ